MPAPGGNNPPVANPDVASTLELQPVTIAVLQNDTDPENTPLVVQSFQQPPGAAVTPTGGGGLIFQPALCTNGAVRFNYTASDGQATAQAQVTVNVTPDSKLCFHSLPPCRLYDTRSGPGRFQPGEIRVLTLAGSCGIPTGARAAAINVTAVNPSANGHFAIFPTGGGSGGTSTLSFSAGRPRANGVVLSLSAQGAITVQAAGAAVDLILDVSGWFE